MKKFLKAPSRFTDQDYRDHPAIPQDPHDRSCRGFIALCEAEFELIDIKKDQIENRGDTLIMTVPEALDDYKLRQALRGMALLRPDEFDFYKFSELEGYDLACLKGRTQYVRLWWD